MSTARNKRVVLIDDPHNQPDEPLMEFRLTYEGQLNAQQRDPKPGKPDFRGPHKHEIRRSFHPQLKRLWEITPFLNTGERSGPTTYYQPGSETPQYSRDHLSAANAFHGFNFVPLVTEKLNLLCGLEILFLRPDRPGGIYAGDLDNRLKVLFDALRMPTPDEAQNLTPPSEEEKPFYCLLQDDKLITKVSVETDQLLQFVTPVADASEVRLVITVRLRPQDMHLGNMQFG